MVRLLILILMLITAAGCTTLPQSDEDFAALRAADPADPKGHLDYLRHRTEIISGRSFTGGNKVTLLHDGAAAYPAMLAAIRSAQHRIDMESFIFDGPEGGKFADALLQRRAAGVEVNVIYDSFGSQDAPDELFDRMRDGGLHVLEYNPLDIDTLEDVNHRDHRKILIIDGKTVFTGGINISVFYNLKVRPRRDFKPADGVDPDEMPLRDTQVKIEGPIAGQFERLFMETWREEDGDPIRNPPAVPQTKRGDLQVAVIDEKPDKDRFVIYRSMIDAIELARTSIHLTTAYFVPPPEFLRALEDAARRGADVTLLLPGLVAPEVALRAGQAHYGELLEAGVKIYEYQSLVLHAKTAVIDGVWSSVGSSNLDWRSAVLNDECNAVILGPAFGRQMETMFQEDTGKAKRITLEDWRNRPFIEMLAEFKAGLIARFL